MKSSRPSCPVRTLHRKLMSLNLTMMSPWMSLRSSKDVEDDRLEFPGVDATPSRGVPSVKPPMSGSIRVESGEAPVVPHGIDRASSSSNASPSVVSSSASDSIMSLNSAPRQFGNFTSQNLHKFSSCLPLHCSCHLAMHRAWTQRGQRHGRSRSSRASSRQIQQGSYSSESTTFASDFVRRGSAPDTMARGSDTTALSFS
mmetsp:Transcript_211/g.662  ORF Transcript_211/g.662 Transcript_211/m.662 type:complete len:200 (+) Transcript_211:772-1371(+)